MEVRNTHIRPKSAQFRRLEADREILKKSGFFVAIADGRSYSDAGSVFAVIPRRGSLMQRILALSILVILSFAMAAPAAVLFTDGFESYTAGNNPLDKNTAGPNSAPNGSGNPWFGPAPPNGRVVGTDSANGSPVSPHSGNNMIRGLGTGAVDLDQNWYNLGYRLNGGSPFTGNMEFDWYFYDPVGQAAGSTNFRDYAALGFYNTAPAGTDYPGTGSLNSSTQIQRLGLGAFNGNAASQTVYEARVVGETTGDAGNGAWFLTGVARSVGWHKGTIKVGPALGDNTNTVDFYVDDIFALERNSKTAYGYNVLEFNMQFGSLSGYFDDVSLQTIPEPASVLLLDAGIAMLWTRRQSRSS